MPLVTDPSLGANSYATVAEADAYNAARPFGTAWAALTPEAKEGALQFSTILLDASFIWTGEPTNLSGQTLCWPRMGMFTRNGLPIDSMVIPIELKYAQAEYARQSVAADLTADNEAAKQGLASVGAGSVSVSFHPRESGVGIALAGSDYAYLSNAVPGAVRLLLVPSWYVEQRPILEALGSRGGFMFEADR